MPNCVLCKVLELSVNTRHALENLVGRSLQDDEAVSITVYKPALSGEARIETSRRLLERIDKTAQRVQGVQESEIDTAIDEGSDYVRHHPE